MDDPFGCRQRMDKTDRRLSRHMQVGEVIFGGIGSGLCWMVMPAILTVFIAGLMAGRTPEYLGKKIERREITLVVVASLIPAVTMLVPASARVVGARQCGTAWL
jgi:K+-transporting ATPase ATPase A chain